MRLTPLSIPLVALLCMSCSPMGGALDASSLGKSGELGSNSKSKCRDTGTQVRFLVVDWTAADRVGLEAAAKRGIVFVRYADCQMEVLTGCPSTDTYGYTPTTARGEHVAIKDEGSLYANLPIGAAKLEGKLRAAGQLDVDMTIAGQYYTDKRLTDPAICPEATHYVTALSVGAFEFSAAKSQEAGAGAKVGGVGAGGDVSRSRDRLSYDGNKASCAQSQPTDSGPPNGCGAPMQVSLSALGERKPGDPSGGSASLELDESSSQTTWGCVATGVGAAGLVVGTVTGAMVISKANSMGESCPDKVCHNQQSDVDSVNRLRPISTVGLVVGAVGVGTGLTLLLTAPAPKGREGASLRTWVGVGSLGLGGTF